MIKDIKDSANREKRKRVGVAKKVFKNAKTTVRGLFCRKNSLNKKMKGNKMKIQNVKIEEIRPYKNNPRKNDNAVDYVAESIKEFGFKVPIIIDKDNVIIAGHTRAKAALKLGMSEVPCIVANDLSDDQVKKFRIIDNKVSEVSEWDFDLLKEELNGMDHLLNFDIAEFGVNDINEINIDGMFEEIQEKKENKKKICPFCGEELP